MNESEKVVAIQRDEPEKNSDRVDAILSDSKVKDILERFPSYRERIQKAAQILAKEENAVKATLEAARAIINRRINVFFSYKSQDEDSAREIVEELRFYAAEKLKITFAGEFPEEIPGARWSREIRDAIQKAHWLILLLPDPSVEWDWCLFETGMFSAHMVSDKVNKLICLHHPAHTKLPPQINDFQAVKADPADIEAFLTKIFVKDHPVPGMEAINPAVKKRLPEIAAKIVRAVKPRHIRLDRQILDRYVLVKIPDARNLSGPEDLDAAQILEIDDQTLGLFGKVGMPRTWAELIENVVAEDADNRWVREIAAAAKKAAGKNAFGPIQATFKGVNSGKLWRPLLHAIDRSGSDTIESFMILFLEEVGVGLTHHIPETTQALISCLRLTFRFRWEIINRYKADMTADQIQELKDSLDRIETEGKSRGNLNPEMLIKSFGPDQAVSAKIEAMFNKWAEYRNDERTGKLDLAIRDKNVEEIMRILNKVAVMNAEFVTLAIERIEKLMHVE
jgi:hypothetical protein